MATNKYNHRLEPCFKQHTGVDAKCGVQVDVGVTLANVHEGAMLIDQIERVEALTGKKPTRVTADKAYASAANFAALEARGMVGIIPPQRLRPASMPLSRFSFDEYHDILRCPEGHHLKPGSRTAHGRTYRAKAKDCKGCALATLCLPDNTKSRTTIIQDGYSALLRARRRYAGKRPADRAAYNSHRFRVEGVHGEAKSCHGLNRATRRGLDNIAIQTWLTAAAINLKRLAKAFLRALWAILDQFAHHKPATTRQIIPLRQILKIRATCLEAI